MKSRARFTTRSRRLIPIRTSIRSSRSSNRKSQGQSGSDLWQRYEEWRKPFVIPKEKLDAVFQAAIKECRARTLAHIPLPPNESFKVEYVTNKSWGGYNWYQGNYHSVIQVNTDLPIYIDRAVDLAAHEGYPGHHVYNVLLEKSLVRDRGWIEMTVYPLFSPQSFVAEGSANYGIGTLPFPAMNAFTSSTTCCFRRRGSTGAGGRILRGPGFDKELNYAGNEAARRYQRRDRREAATEWLQKYAVMSPPRAQQRVKFMDAIAVTSSTTTSAKTWCAITSRNEPE